MTDDEITAALKRLREQMAPDPWPDERERTLGWIRHEIGDVAWRNPIIHAAIMRGLMDRQTRETILAGAVRMAGEALFHQQQMMMRLLEAKSPEPMPYLPDHTTTTATPRAGHETTANDE